MSLASGTLKSTRSKKSNLKSKIVFVQLNGKYLRFYPRKILSEVFGPLNCLHARVKDLLQLMLRVGLKLIISYNENAVLNDKSRWKS